MRISRKKFRAFLRYLYLSLVSEHVHHIGRHLGFFKNFILHKAAANFTEISREHVFAASNRNIIKNRV